MRRFFCAQLKDSPLICLFFLLFLLADQINSSQTDASVLLTSNFSEKCQTYLLVGCSFCKIAPSNQNINQTQVISSLDLNTSSENSSALCIVCRQKYEIAINGVCVKDQFVPNCVNYDTHFGCLRCRPSFSLTNNNRCTKMFSGCLQSQPKQLNSCSKCFSGAVLNSKTLACQTNSLNCEVLGNNRKCIKCQDNYQLDISRNTCLYRSQGCLQVDDGSGLCQQCQQGYLLLGYQCFRLGLLDSLPNCYLAYRNSQNSSVLNCQYCKQGYSLLNGRCVLQHTIFKVNLIKNCSVNSEYLDSQDICRVLPSYCRFFDYGYKKCVYCEGNRQLIGGKCIRDIHKNCKKFTDSDYSACKQCNPQYFLNSVNQCEIFPPYCEQYSGKCLRCIDTFLLNRNALCIDPNCNTTNQLTGNCIQCKTNFVKDIEGICRYVDPNCAERREDFKCLKCRQNYQLDEKNNSCTFVDKNCLNFSSQGTCMRCKTGFYYNINIQRCMVLPDHCKEADERGRCRQCESNFALVTSFECMAVSPLPNCKIVDEKNPKKCRQCLSNYYLDLSAGCSQLPMFCKEYNPIQKKCQTCTQGGKFNTKGECIDKNCQFFDLEGECLGCFNGFEFGAEGQCKPQQKDPNCKQFLFGQCKKCSDRFYFDKQWNCIAVSPLCRQYDENSGLCTRCYSGYKLTGKREGQCILGGPSNSLNDEQVLGEVCVSADKQTGNCLQCSDSYELIKLQNGSLSCMKKSEVGGTDLCVEYTQKGACNKCVQRMFLNQNGKCEEINQNCQKYDESTGECFQCYAGFQLGKVESMETGNSKKTCLVKVKDDPHCKQEGSQTCLECFQGYFYSEERQICQELNNLCATHDLTTGKCLTCFSGYTLTHTGQCIVSLKDNQQEKNQKDFCLKYSETEQKFCVQCVWGFLLQSGTCLAKDLNCKKFINEKSLTCAECYEGYKVWGQKNQRCILESQQVQNCSNYDQSFKCSECQQGYFLQEKTQAPFRQCVVQPDP